MDRKALILAAAWGAVLQLAMVVAGHFVEFIADNLFALGGVLIALAAGFVYGRKARSGQMPGGALAGAAGAFVGILVSVLLGDVSGFILVIGTLAAALGGVGGAVLAVGLAARRRGG